MANDICVLSLEEAGLLEQYCEWPKCRNHIHIKKREAADLVAADTHRFVGGADTLVKTPVSMIVPVGEPLMWIPVPCHAADGTMLMGMRTWGNAPRQ